MAVRQPGQKRLSITQRLASLEITGAMRSTPRSALEVFTCIPPLDLVVQGEATSAVHRLCSLGYWSHLHSGCGHSAILMRLQKLDPIFRMGNDIMRSAYKVEPKYRVTREEWTKRPGSPPVVKGLVLYPDGSKTKRVAGAGVYGQSFGRSISISISVGK